MTLINRACYTREDQVTPLTLTPSKELIEKDNEIDQNIGKIMTQLDILSKNIMGGGVRTVNVVGVRWADTEDMKFEAFYNEKVNFLDNQACGLSFKLPKAWW